MKLSGNGLTEGSEGDSGKKHQRRPKGLPYSRISNGRYQIIQSWKSKKYCISTGLPAIPASVKRLNQILEVVKADALAGSFDTSLDRYYALTSVTQRQTGEKLTPLLVTVSQIWTEYTNFKSDSIEETTKQIYWRNVESWLNKLPTTELKKARFMRDYLLAATSTRQAKRILATLSSACRWALDSGLIEENPFPPLLRQIKEKKNAKKQIEAFTATETEMIIGAFKAHDYWSIYAPLTEFLFLTGCRTSEAIGLRWTDIDWDAKQIRFSNALVQHGGKVFLKALKTQESRIFPMSNRIERLLKQNQNDGQYVFRSLGHEYVQYQSFQESWKKGVIDPLVSDGKLKKYLSQYASRHTFITLALSKGVPVADVARLVGNSPKTIYEHYAASSGVELPDLF